VARGLIGLRQLAPVIQAGAINKTAGLSRRFIYWIVEE
jgi:hypothetical protein